MRRIAGIMVVVLTLIAGAASRATAGIIVDHQPLISGGPASDTLLLNDANQQSWQLLADDIELTAPSTVRQVTWWGFYGSSFSCNINPPVGNETMRVRFYDARPSDGLPGQVLYEESFLNPSRAETGRLVGVGCGPREFRYQATLSSDVPFAAGTRYWVEIVQVGDLTSLFRWENSNNTDLNGFAFIHNAIPDWRYSVGSVTDRAFQLDSIPEPSSICLVLIVLTLPARRRLQK